MVAAGDDVHAGGEKFTGNLGRDAGAAGGVFAIGDDEVERVLLAQFRQKNFDGSASGFAHDVADEKHFHIKNLTVKQTKYTKEKPKGGRVISR
jgi:hypothetical protein